MQAAIDATGKPRHVVWWWLLANWAAWTSVYTVMVLLPRVDAPLTQAAVYFVLGLLAAIPPHFLLARWCRAPVWLVPLCATGWALALYLCARNSNFMGIPAVEWLAYVGAPVAAVAQYTTLRAHAAKAVWWIPGSAGAMFAAALVGVEVGLEAFDRWYSWRWLLQDGYAAVGGSAGGATFGLLSGLVLAALMRDGRPKQPPVDGAVPKTAPYIRD